MKRLVLIAAVGVLCSGCASPGYLRNRGRDLGDIASAEFGYGLGAKARVGPLHTGASWIFTPVGLSNGELYGPAMTEETCPAHVEFIYTGVEAAPRGAGRGKDYVAGWDCWPFMHWPSKSAEEGPPWPHPFYTDLRVAAGLGPAVALGFNPGELLDFLLGWVGIDIYRDDLTAR